MVRKDPFKRVSVANRIYDALDKKRLEDGKDDFRPLPMNAYCEKILWDFAAGKIGYLGKDVAAQMDAMVREKVSRADMGPSQELGILELLEMDPKVLSEIQRKQIALYLAELNDRFAYGERPGPLRHKKTG